MFSVMGMRRHRRAAGWARRVWLALGVSAAFQALLIAIAAARGEATPTPVRVMAGAEGRYVFGDGEQLWRVDVGPGALATHLWARPASSWHNVELDVAHRGYVLVEREDWAAEASPLDLPSRRVPHWQAFADAPALPMAFGLTGRPNRVAEVAVGWPWRAVRCRAHHTQTFGAGGVTATKHLVDAIALPPLGVVPVRPIPSGLVLNIVALAAPALLVLLGVEAGRRVWRRRRARCPWCDYDLAGLSGDAPCPECGGMERRPGGSSRPRPDRARPVLTGDRS
jgi:hypothetical protein